MKSDSQKTLNTTVSTYLVRSKSVLPF